MPQASNASTNTKEGAKLAYLAGQNRTNIKASFNPDEKDQNEQVVNAKKFVSLAKKKAKSKARAKMAKQSKRKNKKK
jgi:hypothetical protein